MSSQSSVVMSDEVQPATERLLRYQCEAGSGVDVLRVAVDVVVDVVVAVVGAATTKAIWLGGGGPRAAR